MRPYSAWIPLFLSLSLSCLLSASLRGADEDSWEDLFKGKDFDDWNDVEPDAARVVQGEAVIQVPGRATGLDRELVYERTLVSCVLEYEFNVDASVDHSLWITLGNGELRPVVDLQGDRRIVHGKWHKLRVEKRLTGTKAFLDGRETATDVGRLSAFALHLVFAAEESERLVQARVRNVRLLDLTTALKPGARAADGIFSNLKGLPRLREVDVSGSKITDKSLDELSRFTTLRKLDVQGTRVTDEGVRRFKDAVPEC